VTCCAITSTSTLRAASRATAKPSEARQSFAAAQSNEAAATATALREVFAGRQHEFRLEYRCTSVEGLR
jgi:hypothetical protein